MRTTHIQKRNNGFKVAYAQRGYSLLNPDRSMIPFDGRLVPHTSQMGRTDNDVLTIVTFAKHRITMINICCKTGRELDHSSQSYPILS